MALFLLGSLFLQAPWLYQEKRFHPQLGRFGDAAPVVAGVAFGFGWSPCIGPILGSILGIAGDAGPRLGRRDAARRVHARPRAPVPRDRARARIASAARSAGSSVTSRMLVGTAAVVLGAFGVLLMFDQLSRVTSEMQQALDGTPFEWLVQLG